MSTNKTHFTREYEELERLFIKKHSKSRIHGGLGELIAYEYLVRCLHLTPYQYPRLTGSSPQILEKIGTDNQKVKRRENYDERFWGKELHKKLKGYDKPYFPDIVVKNRNNNIFGMDIKVNSNRLTRHQKDSLLELKHMGLKTGVLKITLNLTIEKIEWGEL